jgi:prepilin-type N-terminal cleavage/methylation domain-containing protein
MAGQTPGSAVVSRPGEASRAFTLIELLISVIIFGIVLIAINTVFYSGLRLRNHSVAVIDKAFALEQALGVMRHDLQNIAPPDGMMSQWFIIGPVSPYASMAAANTSGNFGNTNNSNVSMGGVTETGMSMANNRFNTAGAMQTLGIQFFATTGVIDDNQQWGELQRVTYQLQPALDREAIGRDLVRSVSRDLLSPIGIEDPIEERLLNNVEDMQIDCLSGTQWLPNWDTTMGDTGLPTAIRIRIQLATEDRAARSQQPIEMIMPLYVQGLTNISEVVTNE